VVTDLVYQAISTVNGLSSPVAHKKALVDAADKIRAERAFESCSLASAVASLIMPPGSGTRVSADIVCSRSKAQPHLDAPASRGERASVIISGTQTTVGDTKSLYVTPFFVNAVADNHVPLMSATAPGTVQIRPDETWLSALYMLKEGSRRRIGFVGISVASLKSGSYRLEGQISEDSISIKLLDALGNVVATGREARLSGSSVLGGEIPLR
jgi:hypothetical protein